MDWVDLTAVGAAVAFIVVMGAIVILLRREPRTKLFRFGVFIERELLRHDVTTTTTTESNSAPSDAPDNIPDEEQKGKEV